MMSGSNVMLIINVHWKSKMATKIAAKRTIFRNENIKIRVLDNLRVTKMLVRSIYHWDA